jgi:hypothetical protein
MQIQIILPIVAASGAVIVVLLYLYYVRGMFRGQTRTTGMDVSSKLRNIKKLANAGKYGTAITLAYRTFEEMVGKKIGSERANSETSREYLDRMVESISVDQDIVSEFLEIYEEARFSGHKMSKAQYENAIRIFTDLYPRVDIAKPRE